MWYLPTITLHSRHLHLIGLLVILPPPSLPQIPESRPFFLQEISSVFAFTEFKGKFSSVLPLLNLKEVKKAG